MSQSIYINNDAEDLRAARVRGATDLRSQKFTQFVAGDSLVLDLYLTGIGGALNIQDYAEVRLGIGNLDARPESGSYVVGGSDTLAYNHTATELETVIDSQIAGATVTKLADFVFKVQFDAVGAQTIPSLDFINLQPRSTVSVTRLVTGDATTKESWLWRLFRDPLAFTNTFTNIPNNGIRGNLSLATAGIYDLIANVDQVQTFFEVELTDTSGNVQTSLQARVKLNGEVIGHNFSGSVPSTPSINPAANAFLESFPDPTIVGTLTSGGIDCLDFGGDGDIVIKPDDNNTQPDAHNVNITGGYRTGSDPYDGGAVNITGGAGNGGAGGDVIIASGSGGGASGSQVDISSDTKVEIDAPSIIMRASSDFSVIGNAAMNALSFGTNTQYLQDYRFGNFTPTFGLMSGGSTVLQNDYAVREANYIKIGRLVFVSIRIKITDFSTAMKNANGTWQLFLKDMPYGTFLTGSNNTDTSHVDIRPIKGWMDIGDRGYGGRVDENKRMRFEKQMAQTVASGFGAPGVGFNLDSLQKEDFDLNPFNFTADGTKAFMFQIAGSYITQDDDG